MVVRCRYDGPIWIMGRSGREKGRIGSYHEAGCLQEAQLGWVDGGGLHGYGTVVSDALKGWRWADVGMCVVFR